MEIGGKSQRRVTQTLNLYTQTLNHKMMRLPWYHGPWANSGHRPTVTYRIFLAKKSSRKKTQANSWINSSKSFKNSIIRQLKVIISQKSLEFNRFFAKLCPNWSFSTKLSLNWVKLRNFWKWYQYFWSYSRNFQKNSRNCYKNSRNFQKNSRFANSELDLVEEKRPSHYVCKETFFLKYLEGWP